jgi:hypothetical protein
LPTEATPLGNQNTGDYPVELPARTLDVVGLEVWALIWADGMKDLGVSGTRIIDGSNFSLKGGD